MDDDIRDRFDCVEQLISHTEKRFDDVKWYFGGAATLFTIGFSVLTLILSWNYKSERDGLRDFQKDIKADLGKIEIPPEVEILATDRNPLAGQEIASGIDKDKDGYFFLLVNHFLKNKGSASTGQMYLKLYSNDPIRLGNRSTDESGFKYEAYIKPKDLDPSELPGGLSVEYYYRFYLEQPMPRPGKYKCLLKVYYAKGKVTQAPFFLVIH